jgi:fumarylacetoacetase
MTHETNATHDPGLRSWVESANDPLTDFPIQNLPFGVFYVPGRGETEVDDARVGVAIGDMVLDVADVAGAGLLEGVSDEVGEDPDEIVEDLAHSTVSLLMLDGPERLSLLRARLSELLREDNDELRRKKKLSQRALIPMHEVALLLPDESRDYTDFYASVHHATNVGSMFRPDNPLLPNYKWMPIGYHGRASTLVPSGAPVRRPSGQLKGEDDAPPVYAPSQRLDYELEVGFVVGADTEPGIPVKLDDAEDHILGLCLVNDWSARDLQKWEYQPLGPFLAKSFATTVGPWVVTLEALAPFRVPAFERAAGDPAPLPHLDSEANRALGGIDLTLEVFLASEQMRDDGIEPVRVSKGSFRHMYWTIAQMLTHHASNGCQLSSGDLMASGTVSGPERDARGCLLELTWAGDPWASPPVKASGAERAPLELPTGETRVFLADGDEVVIRGFCEREGFRRIGFGECRGIVTPATA